jgi:dihydroorotase
MGALTQNTDGKDLAEMMDMHTYGACAFTDGWKPVQNAGLMLKALEYVRSFNGTILQIPLDNALSAGGLMHEGSISTRLGMAGIPALAETLMVHRDIELLRYTNSRLHISGVSTAQSLELIKKAKAEGLMLTCSVTPYHLALTDEALHTYDSVYKVAPPLRSENDRQALIAGLTDGTIDCIASHHRPQEWDAKAKEFEYASEGMNVQENAFSIIWDAVGNMVSLDTMVQLLSVMPRKIFGLPEAVIAEKNKLDFTIFTPDDSSVLNTNNIKSMSRNNPFISKELKGKVLGIINHSNIYLNQ